MSTKQSETRKKTRGLRSKNSTLRTEIIAVKITQVS
jgi:hypothetical protein